MATKLTGRPRGRPRLEYKKPKRNGPGAPEKLPSRNPDRFAVALAAAFRRLEPDITAEESYRKAVGPLYANWKRERVLRSGQVQVHFRNVKPGIKTKSIKGRVTTIGANARDKRWLLPSEAAWLETMTAAFVEAMRPTDAFAPMRVTALCGQAGEIGFATELLLPAFFSDLFDAKVARPI